jgi:hypothetical protein
MTSSVSSFRCNTTLPAGLPQHGASTLAGVLAGFSPAASRPSGLIASAASCHRSAQAAIRHWATEHVASAVESAKNVAKGAVSA